MEKELGGGIDKYLFHYLIHKYKIDDNEKRDPYKAVKKYVKADKIESFYRDFIQKAQYYSKIYNPIRKDGDNNNVCSPLEYSIFTFFKSKRQEQFRPVILSLMHQKDLEHLSKTDYERILNFIKKFFICYTLIGREKSNTITYVISDYAYRIENNYSEKLLEDFFKSFKKRIPNKDWFKKAFSTIGYSNHFKFYMDKKETEKTRLVLETYEEYLSSKNISDEYTIEHILPDADGEQNSNIGNLLPLEKELNDRCKNLILKDKILIYRESRFKSVQKFVNNYENNIDSFDIEKRMSYLADDFYKMINKL